METDNTKYLVQKVLSEKKQFILWSMYIRWQLYVAVHCQQINDIDKDDIAVLLSNITYSYVQG